MELTTSQFFLFLTITLMLTVTPGVDTFLVLRNVLRGEFRDGIYTAIGICSGLFVHASLSALGISLILVRSAMLFQTAKIIGATYLVWLGVNSLKGALRPRKSFDPAVGTSSTDGPSPLRSLREGLLSNVLNPKPAVFYLSFFPQFIGPGEAVFLKSMCLASIQFGIGVIWLILLSLFVSKAKAFMARSMVSRSLEGISGTVLIIFGIKLGLQAE